MSEPNLPNEPTTRSLSIPVGTALDIADKAQALADDARRLADHPNEVTAEDLQTTIRLLIQALSDVFQDLGVDPELSEELKAGLSIGTQAELTDLRQQISDSNDLIGALAAEIQSRLYLGRVVARLAKRVNELTNRRD